MADIATMARKAEKFGQPGLAITDHGNMSGAFQLYRACHNHGILPFPGGLVRSGSKVGSRYKALKASTNDAWCPTLRAQVPSVLPKPVAAVYEIVIDGLSLEVVTEAMRVGLAAATTSAGIELVGAGNYGGQLGQHHIHLRDLL